MKNSMFSRDGKILSRFTGCHSLTEREVIRVQNDDRQSECPSVFFCRFVCFVSPPIHQFQYPTSLFWTRLDKLKTTIIVYTVMQILNIKTEGFLIENILKSTRF